MAIKSYSELMLIDDFYERFEYLKLNGKVGFETFGFDRYLNQVFYRSTRWKHIRDQVIVRDCGCDMGHPDFPIQNVVVIHHMNPIVEEDITNENVNLLNPEFLICVSRNTHNAIHYGDVDLLPRGLIERSKNDTCPWRK